MHLLLCEGGKRTRRTSLGLQCREALWLPPSHATTAICPSQVQPAQKCPQDDNPFFSNALKQPSDKRRLPQQLVRTHLPLSNGHALSGAAARCLASSHGRLRRTTFFCVLRRGLPCLWHQVLVGDPQTPHPLDRARKVLTNCPHHGSSTQLGARWRLLFFKSVCFFPALGHVPFSGFLARFCVPTPVSIHLQRINASKTAATEAAARDETPP